MWCSSRAQYQFDHGHGLLRGSGRPGAHQIMPKLRHFVTLILLTCLFSIQALGQDTHPLSGTVEDSSGEYVVGAEIRLRSKTTGREVIATSGEEGRFHFDELPVGEYVLNAQVPGFEAIEMPVVVGSGRSPSIQVSLQVAAVTQSVVVSANVGGIPTANRNIDVTEIDQHMLENIPIKEGDPLAVASLFLDPAAAGARGPKLIVDGVETSALEVPLTSIRRIMVNQSPYSAEFSRPGRGRIEVTTRKGSRSAYHGNLTFFARNSALDARNAFAKVRPPFQREVGEAEVAGPLRKNDRFLLAGRYDANDGSATINARTLTGPVVENFATPERQTRLFARLDFELTPTNLLTVTYKLKNKSQQNRGVGGINLPERASDFFDHENEVKVFERSFLSPAFMNLIRFAFKDEVQQTTSRSDQPAIIVLDAFSGGGAQISQRQREKVVTIQDAATLVKGKHTIRFGAGARPRIFEMTDSSNFGGTFTFSSLADFAAGSPAVFTLNQGNPRISFPQHEYYSFVQDEILARPNLSLSLGLRYEWQSNLADHNNLGPRFAFAYAPGSWQTVLRGGFGIFYDRQPEIMQQQDLLYDGSRIRQIVISNPSYPVALNGSGSASLATPSVVRIAPGIRTPYLMQESIGVERKLGDGKSFLAVDYTMLQGRKLYRTRNVNAPLPGTGLRPDPNYININQFETSGKSLSHSLNLTFQTSLRNRFDVLAQYTFARAMDDTSSMFSLPANNYDLSGEYGRADYDRRHRFNLVTTCRLAWGFRSGAVVNLSSGIPYNITTGFDNNGDTVLNDRPPGVGRNSGNGPGYSSVDLHLSKEVTLGRGKRGATPRPAARNPAGRVSEAAAARQEGRGTRLELGVDVFNVFNQVNFKPYIGTLTSPFFGRANAANPARQIQPFAKFRF